MNNDEALARKLAQLFSDDSTRSDVIAILDTYGDEDYEREPSRVRLAILKSAGNDLKKIEKYTESANQDFRDILAWAEYPRQSKNWSVPAGPTKEKLIREDRAEYEAWLNT